MGLGDGAKTILVRLAPISAEWRGLRVGGGGVEERGRPGHGGKFLCRFHLDGASPALSLCDQRSLQPVPSRLSRFLFSLMIPTEPFLCGTRETELEPYPLYNVVLCILLCIRSDNSIHHQLMYRKT